MSVDIGLAQWAMHSCAETAGALDVEHLVNLMRTYYATSLKINDDTVALSIRKKVLNPCEKVDSVISMAPTSIACLMSKPFPPFPKTSVT